MPTSALYTGFSIKAVDIAVYSTTPNPSPSWINIPGVEDASYKQEASEVLQYGDNKLLGVFFHSQKGVMTVKATQMSDRVQEVLSGVNASISAVTEYMYAGTDSELNPPYVVIRATIPIRMAASGINANGFFYVFKALVKSAYEMSEGGAYGKLLVPTYTFTALAATQDEMGNALPVGVGFAFGRRQTVAQ